MSRHVVRPQILVIADDFTGGNDAGVSLALTGMTVNVAFTLPCADDADVLSSTRIVVRWRQSRPPPE